MKEGERDGVGEYEGEMRSEHKEKKRCRRPTVPKKMDSDGKSIECKGKQSPLEKMKVGKGRCYQRTEPFPSIPLPLFAFFDHIHLFIPSYLISLIEFK